MKNDPGWTMIETVIVIAISLILSAGVGIPAMQYIERAKVSSARMQIEAYRIALQSYYLDCGKYPNSAQGLQALNQKPTLYPVPDAWNGPYLEHTVRDDPWGGQWLYRCPGEGRRPWQIISFGSDGKAGGSGYESDITSWD